jgi:hypothetical protein
MLDLDSKRWEGLTAAGGSRARLVPRLLRSLSEHPSEQDWAEVWEQVAHQWTLYSSAYAALPHLLRLGVRQGKAADPEFLLNLGRVAAPLERSEECPADLEADFDAALREAAGIALRGAKGSGYEPTEYVGVLYAAAALNGRQGPGIALFWSLYGGGPEVELDCPACGAYLCGGIQDDGLTLQSLDRQQRPLSEEVQVTPREPSSVQWDDVNQPAGDFEWLTALCRRADQDEVLFWLCCLYGKVRCPLCDTELTVVSEVARADGYSA